MFERVRSLAYSLSGHAADLPGLWERVGDDFAGCLILVEDCAAGLQGRITYVPALMRQYGWKVGDIKWRSIAADGTAAYRIEDLSKEFDAQANSVRRTDYGPAKLYFLGVNEFAVITGQRGGRNSRWRRSANVTSSLANASHA